MNSIKSHIIPQKPSFIPIEGPDELDYKAICVFTACGFFLDTDTYYKNRKTLEPASNISFDENGKLVGSKPWFKWHYSPREISFQQVLEEYTTLFETIIQEQVGDSQQIDTSVREITNMLTQIAAALQQLSTGIKQTAESSEDMREIAGRVKSSTEEQAAGSRHIAENMETIREMITRIDEATRDQTVRTEETVASVTNIHNIAETTVDRSEELDKVVQLLMNQTDTLNTEMGSFKV